MSDLRGVLLKIDSSVTWISDEVVLISIVIVLSVFWAGFAIGRMTGPSIK